MIRPLKVIAMASVICAGVVTVNVQLMQAQQRALPADKLLSLGDFYYRNGDVSDKADAYYKQVIRNSPGSQAAGYAQYNRGSYWFRKFYVIKEQYSKEDRSEEHTSELQSHVNLVCR